MAGCEGLDRRHDVVAAAADGSRSPLFFFPEERSDVLGDELVDNESLCAFVDPKFFGARVVEVIVDALQIEAVEDGLLLHEVRQLVAVEVQGAGNELVVDHVHLEINVELTNHSDAKNTERDERRPMGQAINQFTNSVILTKKRCQPNKKSSEVRPDTEPSFSSKVIPNFKYLTGSPKAPEQVTLPRRSF